MMKRSQAAVILLLAASWIPARAVDCPSVDQWVTPTCEAAEIQQLNLNRAYHDKLIEESSFYAKLDRRGSEDVEGHLDSYKMYLALAEEFARVLSPDVRERARLLNAVYERQIEITEARIKGRGNIADQLESN